MTTTPNISADAEAMAQEFKEFAYIVSHDLSTPLRGMVEFSKLLKDEQELALSDEGKEYLGLIIESGQKLQSMLTGLLDYSRLNTMGKPFTKVNCNIILADCQTVLADEIKAQKATFEIATLPTITADAEQLMQLFLMLLDNAIKFHRPGVAPHIQVSGEEKNSAYEFTVRDNGIGIEADFYKRIFQAFQRLHTEKEYPGIGMGLALARKIVIRHGGQIKVEAVPGQGSTFTFTLPVKERS